MDHNWTLPHVGAHKHTANHRSELERSAICGCFYCTSMFPPSAIVDWIDEVEGVFTTALCPRCGIDSVIGSESGFPITRDFLVLMNGYWF